MLEKTRAAKPWSGKTTAFAKKTAPSFIAHRAGLNKLSA